MRTIPTKRDIKLLDYVLQNKGLDKSKYKFIHILEKEEKCNCCNKSTGNIFPILIATQEIIGKDEKGRDRLGNFNYFNIIDLGIQY